MKKRTLKPRHAKTFEQVCSLNSDNKDVPHGWIILNSDGNVVLCNQLDGHSATGEVSFPPDEFNRLIDWYNRPQVIRKKDRKS